MTNLTPDERNIIQLARSLIRDAAMNWARDELAASPEDVCTKLSEMLGEEYDFESGHPTTTPHGQAKKILFEDTVLRKDAEGNLYLMNYPEKGWRSSAFRIPNEDALLATYNVRLGEWTQDKFSEYCPVIRILPDDTKTR
jgi:hypothetical protein